MFIWSKRENSHWKWLSSCYLTLIFDLLLMYSEVHISLKDVSRNSFWRPEWANHAISWRETCATEYLKLEAHGLLSDVEFWIKKCVKKAGANFKLLLRILHRWVDFDPPCKLIQSTFARAFRVHVVILEISKMQNVHMSEEDDDDDTYDAVAVTSSRLEVSRFLTKQEFCIVIPQKEYILLTGREVKCWRVCVYPAHHIAKAWQRQADKTWGRAG